MIAKSVVVANYVTDSAAELPRWQASSGNVLGCDLTVANLVPEAEGGEDIVQLTLGDGDSGGFRHD